MRIKPFAVEIGNWYEGLLVSDLAPQSGVSQIGLRNYCHGPRSGVHAEPDQRDHASNYPGHGASDSGVRESTEERVEPVGTLTHAAEEPL